MKTGPTLILIVALFLAAPGFSETAALEPAPVQSTQAEAAQPADDNEEEADEEGEPDEEQADEDLTLNVWADEIVYKGDDFTCTGNVVITRGRARIECNEVVGKIAEIEQPDEKTGEIKKQRTIISLVATGAPVIMTTDTRKAVCLKVEYDITTATLKLTGSDELTPVLSEPGRTITSKEIIYLLDEDKVTFQKGHIQLHVDDDRLPNVLR